MLRVSGRQSILISFLTLGAAAVLAGCAEGHEQGPEPPTDAACLDVVAEGAALGITAIPDHLAATYGRVFCKYTEIIAPNGKPIRIFAQKEITNEQLVHARGVLAFFLEDERMADWIEELREEGSLTQEYLASVIDSYYGLWGAFTERPGGMWGFYVAKTREEIAEKDPRGYALMEMFFNPYVTYEARVDGGFEGIFFMSFDPEVLYTHKSQYLVNVTLTGENDSALLGNDQDNLLRGNAGTNILDGVGGIDTVRFTEPRDEYEIRRDGDTVTVEDSVPSRDGIDTLTDIERLEFSDFTVEAEEI